MRDRALRWAASSGRPARRSRCWPCRCPALVVGGVAGVAHAAASSLAAGGLLGGLARLAGRRVVLALAGVPAVLAVLMLRRAWRLEPVVSDRGRGDLRRRRRRSRSLFAPEPGIVDDGARRRVAFELRRRGVDVSRSRHVGRAARRARRTARRDRPLGAALPAGAARRRRRRRCGWPICASRRRWAAWPQLHDAVALAHARLGHLAADRVGVRPVRPARRRRGWLRATCSRS